MSPLVRVTIAMTVFLVPAGCATGNNSGPPPRTVTETRTAVVTSTVAPRPVAAPPVTRTLDLTPFRTRPCELLTPDQQAALNLPQPPAGPAGECEWKQATPRKSVRLALLLTEDFFNQAYRQSNDYVHPGSPTRKYGTFEPTTILGQPAVVETGESTDRFGCGVIVGTGQRSSFWVVVTDSDPSADSCPQAVRIAERIVGNVSR